MIVFLSYLIISVNSIAIIFFYSSTPRFISLGIRFPLDESISIRKIRSFCVSTVLNTIMLYLKLKLIPNFSDPGANFLVSVFYFEKSITFRYILLFF